MTTWHPASRIDQDTRIHHSARIEFAFGAPQRLGEEFRTLLVVEWTVEATDGVMVGGRSAVGHGRRGADAQYLRQLIELLRLVEDAAKGEVEAGPIRIQDRGE
jgi:hypothetical protein